MWANDNCLVSDSCMAIGSFRGIEQDPLETLEVGAHCFSSRAVPCVRVAQTSRSGKFDIDEVAQYSAKGVHISVCAHTARRRRQVNLGADVELDGGGAV